MHKAHTLNFSYYSYFQIISQIGRIPLSEREVFCGCKDKEIIENKSKNQIILYIKYISNIQVHRSLKRF